MKRLSPVPQLELHVAQHLKAQHGGHAVHGEVGNTLRTNCELAG
jgi:hypothetical protein